MDWFLYDMDLRHEKINELLLKSFSRSYLVSKILLQPVVLKMKWKKF